MAACTLLAVAGCGGGDPKPTAAEIEAAQHRWRDRVDDVCFDVNRSFGKRGRPTNLDRLGRTVAEGVTEVRAAIRTIVAVPLATGGSRAPAAFVRELKAVDGELAALPGRGADMAPAALVQAADQLGPRLSRLEARAGQAGLTSCMTHSEQELVPEAVRTPTFLKRFERHNRLVQRLPVFKEPASTVTEIAEGMEALGDALDVLVADAATFDPPHDAAKATGGYLASLRRLRTVVRRFEAFARSGDATASPAGRRRHWRAFSRTWREVNLDYVRMQSRTKAPSADDG